MAIIQQKQNMAQKMMGMAGNVANQIGQGIQYLPQAMGQMMNQTSQMNQGSKKPTPKKTSAKAPNQGYIQKAMNYKSQEQNLINKIPQ